MREISLNSGIEVIAVRNERDEVVATLKVNTTDSNTITRYAKILEDIEELQKETEEERKRLTEKYEDKEESREYFVDMANFRVGYIKKIIDEINGLFGDNTIESVYHECYEINEDFLPNEDMLGEFIESIMPVMNELFEYRFKQNTTKYNATKKGKHTKTKDELIAEAKATKEK